MATYRVLIVDDQRELRQMLQSAVETLGPDFDVIAVPSGEEAFLEIRGQEVDLLVSDVILPGISGLELMRKVRERNPDLKVILVTGSIDRQIRRDVADAGADAFFLKPMEPADFLDSVERTLGLVESKASDRGLLDTEKPTESVSERLASLRHEVDAFSAVLLDDRGRILARAGDLPDASVESNLFPALMAVFSASSRVARFLGSNPPNDLSYFSGPKYDLLMAHVGEAYALMVVVNPINLNDNLSKIVQDVYACVGDLHDIFFDIGITLKSEEQQPSSLEAGTGELVLDEDVPLIDALFQGMDKKVPEAAEVDAFWNSVADGEPANGLQSADALTYDQAVQLGLAPEEDEG